MKFFIWKKTDKFIFTHIALTFSIIAVIIILIGGLLFHMIEGWSFFDSIYFVMMTITTIGYWDFVPTSELSKSITMIYAFIWIPIFVSIMWFIFEARFKKAIKWHLQDMQKEISKTERKVKKTEEKIKEIIKKEEIEEEKKENNKQENNKQKEKRLRKETWFTKLRKK